MARLNWKMDQLRFKLKAALERGGFVYVFGVKGNPGEASSQFKKDVLMQLNADILSMVPQAVGIEVTMQNGLPAPTEVELMFVSSSLSPNEMLRNVALFAKVIKPKPGFKPLTKVLDRKGGVLLSNKVTIKRKDLPALDDVGFVFNVGLRYIGIISTVPHGPINLNI